MQKILIWNSMSEHRTTDELREAGLKLTAPRRAIIGLLESRRGEHLSAEEIHEAVKAEGVEVNLSSVYRNLNLLVTLGLVHRVDLSESHTHFGIEHGDQAHLRCKTCGQVSEVDLSGPAGPARRLEGLARKLGFQVTHFRVEAEGKCERCAARES